MELHPTVIASCPNCWGTRKEGRAADGDLCRTCKPVDPKLVRYALARLTPRQMALLRFLEHTLAEQMLTEAEWVTYGRLLDLNVEDDDAVYDGYDEVVPATRHWFAGAHMSFGGGRPDRWAMRLHPLGLALRECLDWGATGALQDDTPPEIVEAHARAA